MCGIVGYVGQRPACEIVVDALRRMEYRGYDSSGVALLDGAGGLTDMGTDFDSFTPDALAYATTGVSAAAQRNRAVLREAMAAGGLSVYDGEWWHFDGPGAGQPRPIINVPLA